ncbi:MAG: cell division protein [Flavobacterium sp. MedPE-SWcel]|uniref:SRPBCC family protein n=1 Tax=uncultured Flavobacterium sp. TaxID=165435 RepID=UPI00091B2CC5|nr:SRPBCC family protein [uncultured Flavobacterium sp.]OIQ17643.1 MAG: cell division protein [Flavobacterium sp. MedPE-SWcel]
MPIIRLVTEIKAPKNIVFDLSRSIDLHVVSTAQTNEEAIAGRTSGLIGDGESVTWRAKHFGVTQLLTSRITVFEKPDYFVDEMVSGTFKSFKHEHIFNEENDVTIMTDIFDYKSPYGVLGRIADSLFLKSYMSNLLVKRNRVVKEFAEDVDKYEKVLSL